MKPAIKLALKIGAAVLVGAAVFVGSTVAEKRQDVRRNDNRGNQNPDDNGRNDNNSQVRATSESGEGLRNVQNVMMKTSQFITTMITVCDAVNRLFMVEPMPRYSSSTIIL